MQRFRMSQPILWYFNFTKWTPSQNEMLRASCCIQEDEKQRLSKFVFKKDFKSSLIGRLMLRKFVFENSDMKYNEIKFVRDPRGKPVLEKHSLYSNLCFNVSHQGDFVAFSGAVTQKHSELLLGVDIMKLEYTGGKSVQEFFRIMNRNFSKSEWEFIKSFSNDYAQICAFVRLWCLKESYVKATGVGITVKLEEISFKINTRELNLINIVSNTELYVKNEKLSNWHFQERLIENTHAVAIASNRKISEVDIKEMEFDELILNSVSLLDKDEEYVSRYFKKLDKM